ncbi:MAG TPA: FxSxx-COOH system tetratricopeptide repeat protein [Actinospica sp.]|jgi:cellulose biosynthesis protein BcsQ|nr:FxSxx-COOH system tetratricopeptide repeat protein [Actinospica sp.]
MTGRDGKVVTFYSYKGGTGRTMALANVAWILASSGKRVLAVDWDLESPGLHRFFHPFLDLELVADTPGVIDLIRNYQWAATRTQRGRPLDWYREYADVAQNTISLEWDFPNGGVLHFMPAGRQNQDYSATLASVNWDEFYEKFGGGLFFDAMRESLQRDYDYVLIDSRTGLSDVAQICTLQLPDILVALFTLSDQGIDGVSNVTQQVSSQYAQRGIRVLPVPTRIDEAEKDKADNGRAYARRRFAGLPQGMDDSQRARYWGDVEVPYRAFYAYEETLAVFGDRADAGPSSLRASLERLARYITQDPTVAAPVVDEPERQRLVGAFTRRRAPHPGDLVLCYVPENRMWVDWITALLEQRGVRTIQYDVESTSEGPETAQALAHNRTLAILSPAFGRSRQALSFARQVADTDPSRSRGQLTAVYVAEMRQLEPFAGRPTIELTGLGENAAGEAVLRALELTGTEPTAGENAGSGPRYPGSVPRIWNIGPRNATFTGRNSVLENLRTQLTAKGAAVVVPVALHGLGGVGKTQVALEYAHRFKADYDLVWWINAEVPTFITESLADLATRLGARVGESLPDAAREAMESLRLGRAPYQRWLLIYDNARDAGDLREFIPSGPGHVLITSRNQAWSEVAEPLEVDVFTRDESIEHLSKRLPTLSTQDAERLALRLDNLPLAVEVAAAWLAETGTPIEDYLTELESSSTKLLSISQPAGYSRTLEATWQISLDRLAERTKAGVRLLELCAFMAPSISVDLIYGQQTLDALAAFDPTLRVPGILGRVIQEISRLALAKIDLQNSEIQIHRLMQDFLRNRLSEREQQERYHLVHRILAAARPVRGDTDDPRNWPQYAFIWPHLGPSRAAECDEDPVRTLLIDYVRFLWKRSQHAQALDLGDRLVAQWNSVLYPPDGQTQLSEADFQVLLRQLLFLRFHMGNVYRSQGDFAQARELNTAVLADQREALGEEDLHTLMTAGGLAADLRGLGRYQDALDMDTRTYGRLRELFGDDHERTVLAAGNLAVSLRLNGDSLAARELDADTLERRRQVLGQKHPYTLQMLLALARDYRELGDYQQSLAMLETAHRDYLESLGPDFVDTLRTATALAISLRYMGEHGRARALTEETAARFRADYAPDHPDALACQINLAADLAATGDYDRALIESLDSVERYERRLGSNHPYTNVARNNYGTYLLRVGRNEEALEQLQQANDSLLGNLGEASPFTQGTGVNLANAYAANGKHEQAVTLGRLLQRQLTERFGPSHPVTLTCILNLSLDLASIGRQDQARQLREHALPMLAEVLGENHPTVTAARAGAHLDRELVPQPI